MRLQNCSINWGEGGSPDHGSLPVAGYECLWPRESRQKMWSRLRRNEGLITKSNVRIVMQSRYQSHAVWEYVHRWNGKASIVGTSLYEHRKSVRACNPIISSLLRRCYGQCTSYWPGKPPALTQDMSKFARSSKNCEKMEKLQFLLKLLNSSGKGGRRAPSKNCDVCNFCDFS